MQSTRIRQPPVQEEDSCCHQSIYLFSSVLSATHALPIHPSYKPRLSSFRPENKFPTSFQKHSIAKRKGIGNPSYLPLSLSCTYRCTRTYFLTYVACTRRKEKEWRVIREGIEGMTLLANLRIHSSGDD
uniref:Uncharacterized protein n=2 Tax=Picea TaxID=3328 RepID=A0A117NGT3_PICGL|nr:hypothetical protein ABT39_MTgene5472 [Picea glauca]QHR91532.1 hypothetical protein Q903MT_gene5567 [Picea sitchensis]